MLLDVARELVGVVRTFRAGENRAMNALRMPSHRREREVSAVADGPETDLVRAESFPQVFEIVGALVRVVTREIDTLNALRRVLEKDILAFIKPFNSERAAAERENYYMEREWRKYGNLLFDFDKVTRVWVAEGFADRLRYDLPAYEGPIDAVTGAAT